jgi:hypothetical protein
MPAFKLLMKDNTWNAFGCNINETIVLENAQYMKESGLLEAGYKYVVIDGTSMVVVQVNDRLLDVAQKVETWRPDCSS